MKKTIYSIMLLIGSAFALTSCSDWLDVSPKTEVREGELFSTEAGYRNAMSGVYILLGQKPLYGVQASMYVPEFLAHTWTTPSESTDASAFYLAKNDYTNSNVESTLDDLWSNYYNAIAQINNILTNLQSSSVAFTGNQRQIMEGELYGLRAFLHLDLLRFFGPVPSQTDGATACIPYVKTLTTDVANLKSESYDAVKADIISDLDKAESLLATSDPIVESRASADDPARSDDADEANVDLDDNDIYRQLHFNYWAVIGAKARYYYWIGDKEKAADYARKVIEAKDKAGKQVFALCNEAYYSAHSNANLTMKMEQLYGVYNSSYQNDIYRAYYSTSNPLFTQNEEYVKTAYESTLYPDDIRFKSSRYWKSQMADNAIITEYHFLKYAFNGSWYGYNTVPVMRLSEMYFILFECASIADMKPYFATWRLSRGLDASIDATLTTESAVVSRMEKEWRKEFMGEGQMFFFYKKHNYQAYTWPTAYTVPTGAYQLPKPMSQTMYE